MWLLTHDGDCTQKKRYWLRPGTSHLLGRTRSNNTDFNFYIEAKSVSRKHLVITVRDVDANARNWAAVNPSAPPPPPSEIVLADSSKFGTWLDGVNFKEKERVLGGGGGTAWGRQSHEIRLGNWDVAWRLEWHPIVLTASGGSGGTGGKKNRDTDLSGNLRKRLAPFDIAVVAEYVAGATTHVVSHKRNTPRVLQALAEGRQHVVTEAFVDALEKVARKREAVADGEGSEEVPRAPLEEDFDGNWPDEGDFVPPPGPEPVPRPADMLRPDAARETVFSGYTFIFSDRNQFDQLGAVVRQGTGKALLRELETVSDDVEGFIRFVKNTAGENGMGEFKDGSEGKGVVVVRLTEPRGHDEEWWGRFYHSVDLGLNQRSINQNEFLDAIITNDASPLRRPLEQASQDEVIPSSISGPPPSTSVGPSQISVVPSREGYTQGLQSQMPDESTSYPEPPVPKTTRKGFRRALTESRFRGFDDFDPDMVPKAQPVSDDDDEMEDATPSHAAVSQSSLAQSQRPEALQAGTRAARGTKRPHEPAETMEILDDGSTNAIDKLFPAAHAMKKRRLEEKLKKEEAMEDIPEEAASKSAQKPPKKSSLILPSELRKREQVMSRKEVIALARGRREMGDEERRKKEEQDLRIFENLSIEDMKKLAKVETMEIAHRKKPVADKKGTVNDDECWKPEWNGRKNFKKFRKRRPGDQDGDAQAPIRSRRVIVTLEEVQTNDLRSRDDEYLLDNTSTFDSIRTRPRASKGASHAGSHAGMSLRSTSNHPGDTEDDDDGLSFRRASHRSGPNSQQSNKNSGPANSIALRPGDEVDIQDLDPEEIAGEPRNANIASAASAARNKNKNKNTTNSRPDTAVSTASASSSSTRRTNSNRAVTSNHDLETAVPSDDDRVDDELPPPPPYSEYQPSTAWSSQTLAGDSGGGFRTQDQLRPESRGSGVSAASTAAASTRTRGAAANKRGVMGPPATPAEDDDEEDEDGDMPPPAKKQKKGPAAAPASSSSSSTARGKKGVGRRGKGGKKGQTVVYAPAQLGRGLGLPDGGDGANAGGGRAGLGGGLGGGLDENGGDSEDDLTFKRRGSRW